jgi:hypothetical protein
MSLSVSSWYGLSFPIQGAIEGTRIDPPSGIMPLPSPSLARMRSGFFSSPPDQRVELLANLVYAWRHGMAFLGGGPSRRVVSSVQPSPSTSRFTECRLAQRILSGFRGLHADKGFR